MLGPCHPRVRLSLFAITWLLGACGPGDSGRALEGQAQAAGRRIEEPTQGLSVWVPEGLNRIETRHRGKNYPSYVAPDVGGNAPSIVALVDPAPLASGETLEAFVERNRSALQGHLQGYVEVSSQAFAVDLGVPAWKLSTRSVVFAEPFLRNYYFLMGPRGGYLFTSTQVAADTRPLEAVFDAVVRSVEFLPEPPVAVNAAAAEVPSEVAQ
jgi:hypothetical protein